jgi:hypothetical protein
MLENGKKHESDKTLAELRETWNSTEDRRKSLRALVEVTRRLRCLRLGHSADYTVCCAAAMLCAEDQHAAIDVFRAYIGAAPPSEARRIVQPYISQNDQAPGTPLTSC